METSIMSSHRFSRRLWRAVIGVLALCVLAGSCTNSGSNASGSSATTGQGVGTASFVVRPGVELATVTKAKPGAELTLVDKSGKRLITEVADDQGQALFAFV